MSAAEAGWDGASGRVRHFDVNELVALAIALRVPLAWFFLPPGKDLHGVDFEPEDPWISPTRETKKKRAKITPDLLLWLALAAMDPDDPDDLMTRRLRRDGVVAQASFPAEVINSMKRHLAELERMVGRSDEEYS